MKNRLKTQVEIAAMRESGKRLAGVLEYLKPEVVPGVTTKHLANLAAKKLKVIGGEPAFLGYHGYPDVICISVNEEVVHGVPGDRLIQAGDIVGLDFGVVYDKMITDGAITMAVGEVDQSNQKLIAATYEALLAGIDKAVAGNRTGDIGAAIEARLRRDNFGVIEHLVGHGVGHHLHEDPAVPNFGTAGRGAQLKVGMTIAIEPMATLGGKDIEVSQDGWTIMTADDSHSAHFEHTILITDGAPEILTLS